VCVICDKVQNDYWCKESGNDNQKVLPQSDIDIGVIRQRPTSNV
jgi:hypothetical protein